MAFNVKKWMDSVTGVTARRHGRQKAEGRMDDILRKRRELEESRIWSDPRFRSLLDESGQTLRDDIVITPEMEEFLAEEYPELLEDTEAGIEGLAAQRDALKEWKRIAESTDDPRFRALVDRAQRRANIEAQQRMDTLQQRFARRGQAGSGMEMAQQIGSAAEAMDRAAEMNLGAASQAYENRLRALAQSAELGGRIRQDELRKEASNLDAINRFNQRQTEERRRVGRSNLERRERAKRENLQRFLDVYGREKAEAEGIRREKYLSQLGLIDQEAAKHQRMADMEARDRQARDKAYGQILGLGGQLAAAYATSGGSEAAKAGGASQPQAGSGLFYDDPYRRRVYRT